jgi:hypothetical protein
MVELAGNARASERRPLPRATATVESLHADRMLPGQEVDAAARGDHAVISVIVHDLQSIDIKLLPSSGASEKLWVPPTDRFRKPSNSRVTHLLVEASASGW